MANKKNGILDSRFLEDGKIQLYRRYSERGNEMKVWQARFKFPKLSAVRVSTGHKNFRDAERWARNELFHMQARYESGLPLRPKVFSDVYTEYLKYQKTAFENGTISISKLDRIEATFENYLKKFFEKSLITEINDDQINSYLAERINNYGLKGNAQNLEGRKPANATVNIENTVLREILRYAHRNGYIVKMPNIPTYAQNERRQDFSDDEWKFIVSELGKEVTELKVRAENKLVLKHAYKYRLMLKTLVQLIGYSGVRAGRESNQNLRWNDIKVVVRDGDKFTRFPISTTKNKDYPADDIAHLEIQIQFPKYRTPPRNAIALHWLESPLRAWRIETDFPNETDYVFAHQNEGMNGEPGASVQALKKQFKEFLKKHNLLLDSNGKNRTLTSARHFFATQRLLYSEVGVYLLADSMGTSVRMIEKHYGHVAPSKFAEKLADVSAFD
jgi:integrase